MYISPWLVPVSGACQSSCKITSQCGKLDSGSCNPDSCPYCIKTLANDPELVDNEAADSDSEGVYEFTQDAHYSDRRDPQRGEIRGKKMSRFLVFWNIVCETFRKIVDSKYFGRGIMIAILINTLSMGIEYHEQVSTTGQFIVQSLACVAQLMALHALSNMSRVDLCLVSCSPRLNFYHLLVPEAKMSYRATNPMHYRELLPFSVSFGVPVW